MSESFIEQKSRRISLSQERSHRLLSHNAVGHRKLGAGGLLILDSRSIRGPGSILNRILVGKEPVGDFVEHCDEILRRAIDRMLNLKVRREQPWK